ncbi:MAG TPA: LacI family DNA-binding transcriptional regulator, partial [Armatimonadota bacterium]
MSKPKQQAKSNAAGVTIRDIAERCGVGIATVSRALNAPDTQNPNTSARILAVAKEMGYDPTRYHCARRLVSKHGKEPINHLIAVFLPQDFYKTIYYSATLQGIMAGLTERGFGLLTIEIPYAYGTAEILPQDWISILPPSFNRGDVDGVIGYMPEDRFVSFAATLRALPTFGERPIVILVESTTASFSIKVDRQSGAREAAHHLLATGHRH